MKRYVKLFEDFQERSLDIMDVADLLKKGDAASAKRLLHEIVESSEEMKFQYDITNLPPVELEKACGISGISKMWKMPFGFTNREMEFLFRQILENGPSQEVHENEAFIYEAMKSANPDLKVPSWIYDTYWAAKKGEFSRQQGDVVGINVTLGCTSGMNLDDMVFYISEYPEIDDTPRGGGTGYVFKVSGEIDEGYSELYTKAQILSKRNVSWFPAPSTLELIIEKLEERA